ncbi:hypothetical protein TOPH_07543 [Tolypocladium ophioglossoides CBS 100239]|uniref:ATP synthase subunit J, mitochondrial n=1 Tax=Tolypocladium ophioglossoides (strain CBS 100239) TaxID=1163406 RepID=A0A0L0N1T5_TOLOC|nr:hypothetical protein TOPH_07543 [Tolypocladium ophioglossoides CBS 100239]
MGNVRENALCEFRPFSGQNLKLLPEAATLARLRLSIRRERALLLWSSKKARREDSISSNLAAPSTHSDPRDTHEPAHDVLARRHPLQEVSGSFPEADVALLRSRYVIRRYPRRILAPPTRDYCDNSRKRGWTAINGVAGLVIAYGANSAQNAMMASDEWKNDPRNPNAKTGSGH